MTEVIEKHEKHSQAYERRGYVNFTLRNYEDALYDFRKSIGFDHMNASSWYGIGRCLMLKKDYQAAVDAFDETTKQSIALQPIYWAARRFKGLAHLEMKEFDKAAIEFKFLQRELIQKTILITDICLLFGLIMERLCLLKGKSTKPFKHLIRVWLWKWTQVQIPKRKL